MLSGGRQVVGCLPLTLKLLACIRSGLMALAPLVSLRALDISGCTGISSTGVQNFVTATTVSQNASSSPPTMTPAPPPAVWRPWIMEITAGGLDFAISDIDTWKVKRVLVRI